MIDDAVSREAGPAPADPPRDVPPPAAAEPAAEAAEPAADPARSAGPAADAAAAADATPAADAAAAATDGSLVALVGRLADLLAGSDLSELEIQAGDTALVLRKPPPSVEMVAVTAQAQHVSPPAAPAVAAQVPAATPAASASPSAPAAAPADRAAGHAGRLVVAAPLTGVWYSSATPGAPAFVSVGSSVSVGQVIGLIEAMKLFNEIKSDRAGRVARVVPDNGALVRAKQPLIEVEPL